MRSPRFRWVQCSIDTLNRCVTLKEVQRALDNLPEGLDETYERILLAIDTKTREGQLALRALVWLVAALRPLHIDELMEGLSIDLERRTLDFSMGPMHRDALLDACGSLVAYNEKGNIIILSHFSVKVSSKDRSVHLLRTFLPGVPHERVRSHQTTTVPHQLGTWTRTASSIMHVLYFCSPQAFPETPQFQQQ